MRFSALQRAEIAEISTPDTPFWFALCFSALQRAEIAEMQTRHCTLKTVLCFSALQRAEIAEIGVSGTVVLVRRLRFSALQRAEIAEIERRTGVGCAAERVSVLFNEPKLLKSISTRTLWSSAQQSFSALQRAEIAEISRGTHTVFYRTEGFQCSSTSRNC